MLNTTNARRTNKVVAIIALLCFLAAGILGVYLLMNHENRISALERKIENGSLTSADISAYAEKNSMNRDDVLQIVAEYITANKVDYTQFVTRDEVATMIAEAIAIYDRTRFDAQGHCLCCPDGNHVVTKTEYVDNSTHSVEYVENPFDPSGYYTAEQVDQLIHDILTQQVQDTIPETNAEDQEVIVTFVEADPGFQSELVDNGEPTVTDPNQGTQGEAVNNSEPTVSDPDAGTQGEVVTEPTTEASEEAPVGQNFDVRKSTETVEETTVSDPATGEQGTAVAETSASFVEANAGEQGEAVETLPATFVEAANGEQSEAVNNSELVSEPTVSEPDAGSENGTIPEGQSFDIRKQTTESVEVEVTDPNVGFGYGENTVSEVIETTENTTETVEDELPEGFIPPSAGEGIGD